MKSQPSNKKILLIITQGIWGGAQRYVFDLATHFPPNYEVSVAIGEPKGPPDLQQALLGSQTAQVKVLPLKKLVRAIRPLSDLLAIFELRHLIKAETPDTIHLNSSKAGIIGALAVIGLKNRPRVVYTVHGWVFLEPLSPMVRWLYKFLEKNTARFKDRIIVLSEKEKKIALTLGIPESKLTIIPLGIDQFTTLSPAAAQAELSPTLAAHKHQGPWIGTIANLFSTKGLDVLIEAAKTICAEQPNLHFFIIGTGPQKMALEKLIRAYHLETQVHLIGPKPKAACLLPAFDLFVLPSRKEGLPYTILEAMFVGLPIVATAVGGVSSVLANYPNSLLVPPNNTTALTKTIQTALNKFVLQPTALTKTVAITLATEMTTETLAQY